MSIRLWMEMNRWKVLYIKEYNQSVNENPKSVKDRQRKRK